MKKNVGAPATMVHVDRHVLLHRLCVGLLDHFGTVPRIQVSCVWPVESRFITEPSTFFGHSQYLLRRGLPVTAWCLHEEYNNPAATDVVRRYERRAEEYSKCAHEEAKQYGLAGFHWLGVYRL